MSEKRTNEIKVIAKLLRQTIATKTELEMVMNELFKGQAEVRTDDDDQLIVYTGHTYGLVSLDVLSMSGNKYFLDEDKWERKQ